MEYRRIIVEGLRNRYPEVEVRIEKVRRNNGCFYDGIFAKLDQKVLYSPIIACERYEVLLEQGKATLEEVLDDIEIQLKSGPHFSIPQLMDYEEIKNNLRVRVINYERNQELLKDIPHRRFLDLAIVYYISFVMADNMDASMYISNALIEKWNISEKELLDVAYHNTFRPIGVRIRKISDVMASIIGKTEDVLDNMVEELEKGESLMYVADTGTARNGSVAILMKEAFQQFAEQMSSDIFILPSSLHELILVLKKNDIDQKNLQCMVEEVNRSMLSEEEILSDHVYLYQRSSDEFVDLCSE